MTIARAEPGIARINPAEDRLWSTLIDRLSASAFHSQRWIKVVADTYGFEFEAAVLTDETGPVAGLAWSDIDDLNGFRRVSLPFCDYAGPLAIDPALTRRLLDVALGGVVDRHLESYTLKTFPDALPSSALSQAELNISSWMGLDVSGSDADIAGHITAAARKGVRRARKEGVTVRLAANKDDLRRWFEIHLDVRKRRHRLLAQPFGFFERIWDAFIAKGDGFLMLTELNSVIIGGKFCLQLGDTVYTKFSASDGSTHRMKPNNLLFVETIAEAQRRGAKLIDMGRNPRSAPGLIYFKKSFGAYERDLLSLRFVNEAAPMQGKNGSAAFLSGITQLLTDDRVPDDVTESAGNLLYHNFA